MSPSLHWPWPVFPGPRDPSTLYIIPSTAGLMVRPLPEGSTVLGLFRFPQKINASTIPLFVVLLWGFWTPALAPSTQGWICCVVGTEISKAWQVFGSRSSGRRDRHLEVCGLGAPSPQGFSVCALRNRYLALFILESRSIPPFPTKPWGFVSANVTVPRAL